ncbi:response regulator [Gorillibacterium sp. sgz500922]|uniref:response regulator n=1 Tax=Gorillibacterium sp. sgz500922 TaxID=3446694 RepID=UPI003F66E494
MYHVFIVDDEPFILNGLRDILDWEQLGLNIVGQAENGKEALDRLADTPVDLLITDISMPVMDGLELIRSAKPLHPGMKVLVLSGYDEFRFVKEGLSLGIENYLLKPINLEEFQRSLETIVEKLNASRVHAEWTRYTTGVLKDNVLLRWMRNQIDPNALAERLALLDLAIEKPFIQAALVKAEPITEAFQTLAADFLEKHPALIPFWDMNNDLVLLHNGEDSTQGPEELKTVLEELTTGGPAGIRLRASVGGVEETACACHLSYEQALQGQEFLAIHPERRVVFYEELNNRIRDLKEYLPDDWQEYTSLIASKNRDAVREKLEAYLQAEPMENLTPEQLRAVAMEWMLYFRVLIKELRDAKERESIQQELLAIGRTQSLPELFETLHASANRLIDLYDREVRSPIVNQALAYIEKHYRDNLSLKKLAAEFNIHPVYLGQLFHKSQGEPFADYLNRYRVEMAKHLLQTTNRKVQDIANEVGYWDIGYFYKQFKKFVGLTPSQFKTLS